MKQLSKLPSLIKINLKNIGSNYIVIISFLISTVLLSVVCSGLISDYEDKSSIPIGVVDLDQSDLSQSVIEKLATFDGVILQNGTKDELLGKLKQESIYAYFIINQGFEEAISRYDYSKHVQMIYLGQNRFVSILSDIFAQAMIKDVVYKEGERLYHTFPDYEDLVYATDYKEYINNEYEVREDSFAFEYQYYNATDSGAESTNAISNNIISTEMFLALGGMFLVFFVMQLISAMDKSAIVVKRSRLSLISCWTMELADIITLFLVEGIMAFLVLWYLFGHFSIGVGSHLFSLVSLVTVFLFAVTFFFICLRRMISSKSIYQFMGFIVSLTFGAISILEILGQIKVDGFSDLAKNIPNYWFIGGITDIILGGKTISLSDVAYTLGVLVVLYGIVTFAKYNKLEK